MNPRRLGTHAHTKVQKHQTGREYRTPFKRTDTHSVCEVQRYMNTHTQFHTGTRAKGGQKGGKGRTVVAAQREVKTLKHCGGRRREDGVAVLPRVGHVLLQEHRGKGVLALCHRTPQPLHTQSGREKHGLSALRTQDTSTRTSFMFLPTYARTRGTSPTAPGQTHEGAHRLEGLC